MESLERIYDEERILRRWTPLILRTILIVASLVLIAGLATSAVRSPGYYVQHFRLVQSGKTLHDGQSLTTTLVGAAHGSPHDIMTLGLIVLTMVPIVRVAFTFILFIEERDLVFVVATAYVLAGLVVGILLGSVG